MPGMLLLIPRWIELNWEIFSCSEWRRCYFGEDGGDLWGIGTCSEDSLKTSEVCHVEEFVIVVEEEVVDRVAFSVLVDGLAIDYSDSVV